MPQTKSPLCKSTGRQKWGGRTPCRSREQRRFVGGSSWPPQLLRGRQNKYNFHGTIWLFLVFPFFSSQWATEFTHPESHKNIGAHTRTERPPSFRIFHFPRWIFPKLNARTHTPSHIHRETPPYRPSCANRIPLLLLLCYIGVEQKQLHKGWKWRMLLRSGSSSSSRIRISPPADSTTHLKGLLL